MTATRTEIFSYIKENKGTHVAELQFKYGATYSEAKAIIDELVTRGELMYLSGVKYVTVERNPHGQMKLKVNGGGENTDGGSSVFKSIFGNDDDEEDGEKNAKLKLDVLKACVERGTATASFIQRTFSTGYLTAFNIMEWMEEQGFISPSITSNRFQPHTVLLTKQQYKEKFGFLSDDDDDDDDEEENEGRVKPYYGARTLAEYFAQRHRTTPPEPEEEDDDDDDEDGLEGLNLDFLLDDDDEEEEEEQEEEQFAEEPSAQTTEEAIGKLSSVIAQIARNGQEPPYQSGEYAEKYVNNLKLPVIWRRSGRDIFIELNGAHFANGAPVRFKLVQGRGKNYLTDGSAVSRDLLPAVGPVRGKNRIQKAISGTDAEYIDGELRITTDLQCALQDVLNLYHIIEGLMQSIC